MATREQVRSAMHRQPFVGFQVHLSSGQSLYVKHPDFISIPASEAGRDVVIHDDKGMHLIDVLHIAGVSVPEVATPAGSSAEGNGS